jgi:hypothetical protein
MLSRKNRQRLIAGYSGCSSGYAKLRIFQVNLCRILEHAIWKMKVTQGIAYGCILHVKGEK